MTGTAMGDGWDDAATATTGDAVNDPMTGDGFRSPDDAAVSSLTVPPAGGTGDTSDTLIPSQP